MLPKTSWLYRRTLVIYFGAIVAPALTLLWLGLESFDRQRQALATLTAEKLAIELERGTQTAAKEALAGGSNPAAKYFFTLRNGVVVEPALRSPLPESMPADFQEAQRQEFVLERPDLALESYQRLLAARHRPGLALSGIARCLRKLGRNEESEAAWRTLAASYPDEPDLSHRPFGIVAAIEAGDVEGLYDQIASGRWDLAADQAEYFLSELDPTRTTPYLDRFRFARELGEHFRPQSEIRGDQIYSFRFGEHRIFYRAPSPDGIEGFLLDDDWILATLKPQLESELGIHDEAARDSAVYAAGIGLVLIVLSTGVILLWRDVSREKRTNRLHADFVSSVSHELKTPITLIRLYSETLLGRPGLDRKESADFTRIILRESARLTKLVDQILAFSRLERGDQIYNFEEGDPAPVIARVVEDYREYLEHAGFSLRQAMPLSLPAVRFDPATLSQAVVNLLDNAVKYSGDAREIAVRMDASETRVTFEVEDHGLGIPSEEQQKIFERFYRIANGSGKGGYGLGLFMVRHIMEAHGGKAEVESVPGHGSRFRLVLPVVTQWARNAS